jgi:hypothetical protein
VGVRLLQRLCNGKDSDADRRRNAAVAADVAPILLEVLSSNDMYVHFEHNHRSKNPASAEVFVVA